MPKNYKIFVDVFTCILNIYVQYESLKSIFRPEIPNFLEFRQGGRGEWGIGKSIPNQISQIIVYGNHLCQVKTEHKKQWTCSDFLDGEVQLCLRLGRGGGEDRL